MRITEIRATQPPMPGSPADWRTTLGQILVVVQTDAGLTGYGVGGGGAAGVHVVQTVLRDLLVGRDPSNVEALWEEMYRATLPFGRKGLALMAISGVDLAMWDLRGKAAGQPIVQVLGGQPGQAIPVYATTDDIAAAVEQGYRGFKLPYAVIADDSAEQLGQRVAQARRLIGEEPPLMIDAFMQWDVDRALHVAAELEPYNLAWIEEPLPPDDLTGYARLCRESLVPIAGGEHEFTARSFAEIIDRGCHHVLQPDVCWCGGLTELVKIYRLAAQAGLRVCPHRGAEIWSLHAIAALDPDPLAESGRPWMDWLMGPPPLVDGHLALGDAPGFGVTIPQELLP